MRAAESAPTTGMIDRYHLNFALGKALEDRGEYEESFRRYERGNALKRTESKYSSEIIENKTRRQIEHCTRELFASRRGWGAQNPDPIFIVGLPRSGSTLLEQILASHSQVEGTMELPNILNMVAQFDDQSATRDGYPETVGRASVTQLAALGRRYLEETAPLRSGRAHFTDK